MLLLKIGGSYFIASSWQLEGSSFTEALKGEGELDHALVELCWHMTSCSEVHETFEYYTECPVCLAREDKNGHLEHKHPVEILN